MKNHGTKPVGGEQTTEQFSFAEKVFLPDEFVERLRTHSYRKRFGLSAILTFFGGKELGHVDRNIPFFRSVVYRAPMIKTTTAFMPLLLWRVLDCCYVADVDDRGADVKFCLTVFNRNFVHLARYRLV